MKIQMLVRRQGSARAVALNPLSCIARLQLWRRIHAGAHRSAAVQPVGQQTRQRSLQPLQLVRGVHSQPAAAAGPRIAIVGSGPSAFYTAKYLLQDSSSASSVDMFDMLCTPFGLVRFGVAPDHPEVKVVVNDFEAVASNPSFRFFGNVKVGEDVTTDFLKSHYDAVVVACGAAGDRALGIPGEEERGVFSARAFVNWYNGHPDYVDMDFGLSSSGDTAVIIGQGNVAMDVARILASPVDRLATTDITAGALEALAKSSVRHVHVIGRRGPGQAACTIKEFRELTKLPGCRVVVEAADVQAAWNAATEEEVGKRPRKRLYDLMMQHVATAADAANDVASGGKCIYFRFLSSPARFEGKSTGEDSSSSQLDRLHLKRTRLEGAAGSQRAVTVDGEDYSIGTGLCFKSVGYKTLPFPGLPHDPELHVIPSKAGRVTRGEEIMPKVYVTGWAKRGPTGIIGSNIPDARETARSVLEDLKNTAQGETGRDITKILRDRGIKFVDLHGWRQIDREEKERGEKIGKPREKMVRPNQMVAAASRHQPKMEPVQAER